MKRILVSQRLANNHTYPERRDALAHDWAKLFTAYDILPILIPNAIHAPAAYFELNATGLLLTGGDNIGPADDPTERDATEQHLVTSALERNLPILGVCRGLQMLNRHFGGRIESALTEPHVGDHDVRLENGIVQRVNSFHEQGVMRGGLAPDLVAFAQTEGGMIEALRHSTLPILAVQWHPERPSPSAALDEILIKEWLNKCA